MKHVREIFEKEVDVILLRRVFRVLEDVLEDVKVAKSLTFFTQCGGCLPQADIRERFWNGPDGIIAGNINPEAYVFAYAYFFLESVPFQHFSSCHHGRSSNDATSQDAREYLAGHDTRVHQLHLLAVRIDSGIVSMGKVEVVGLHKRQLLLQLFGEEHVVGIQKGDVVAARSAYAEISRG